ncbi:hypothetical protein CHLNCDRAFT_140296 [Chlorella variabilis]|uniref:Uncharacterized protein n=1 Tax=Chlorella variabilis TaxID=554065 RepID=E1Z6P7_CHLVA|nr:hypothetical protein CHLNCDRAFT_140296 [Chlorella variabilis]EFN58686.1 hypothetical protein CHLNCDRAFT_140296 [Chlorella variabilis]|eukprot:XP_005850788.1 hypothetical protein CHLNCDRAFT_140296 [Chlorella variabilis]
MRRGSTGWPSTRPLQADVTRLVEAGGGARLEALGVQGEAAAASVAARLEGHERELADAVQKRAVLECVPSLLLTALSRVQDCFCLEVVGRNCLVLQGPGTDPAAVAHFCALAAVPPKPGTVTLLN